MRPVRPITPLANAAEEVEQQLRKQQLLQQQRRSASTGKMRQKQQPQGWLYSAGGSAVPGFGCSSSGGADQAVPPAAKRLFQDAVVRMQRAEQTKEMTAEAERKARCWSARRYERAAVVLTVCYAACSHVAVPNAMCLMIQMSTMFTQH